MAAERKTNIAVIGRHAEIDAKVILVDDSHAEDPADLVELARQIQKADDFTRSNACSKLTVIAEQVRFLQEQARRVLEDAKMNSELHRIPCNFKRIPGHVYYLYRRQTGTKYFSMLSPQEWGTSCPHEFIRAYKLESDMSWTAESDIEKREAELQIIHKILDSSQIADVQNRLSIQLNSKN